MPHATLEEAALPFMDVEAVEPLGPAPQRYEPLPVASLSQENVEGILGLRQETGMILDHVDPIPVPGSLKDWLEISDIAYGTRHAGVLSTPRSKLNLLLLSAYGVFLRSSQNPARRLVIRNEEEWTSSPILWEGQHWTMSGRPDYAIWYGEEAETAVKVLVVEVENGESELMACSRTLQYMAWVHRYRQDLGMKNATVYGISTDTEHFRIMMIDDDSRWFSKVITVSDNDYSHVLGILVHLMTEAANIPPLSPEEVSCLQEMKRMIGADWFLNFGSASD